MKKLLLSTLLALPILALPILAAGADAAPKKKVVRAKSAAKVKWHMSMASGLAEAKKTGKPIFVDFYTTWCGPCKYLDDVTYKDAKFITESKKWVMVKLDAEKDPNVKLAEKYKIEGYPSMLFLKPNGRESSRVVGGYPANLLVPKMKKALDAVGGGQRI